MPHKKLAILATGNLNTLSMHFQNYQQTEKLDTYNTLKNFVLPILPCDLTIHHNNYYFCWCVCVRVQLIWQGGHIHHSMHMEVRGQLWLSPFRLSMGSEVRTQFTRLTWPAPLLLHLTGPYLPLACGVLHLP